MVELIKIMLVAGKNSKQLAEFLEQRGTFTVDFTYNDLNGNAQELLKSIIKVDKLVYIFQTNVETGKAEMNVRLDMQLLREMLLDNKFFKANEILFLCGSGKENSQAKKYFTAVMTECGVKNSSIRTLDGIASYSSVYDNLIGVTLNNDFQNHYRNLYRRGKGDDATLVYEPKSDRDVIIEPFNYDELKAWDERKDLVKSIEAKVPIEDSDESQHFVESSVSLPEIKIDDVEHDVDVILVTGQKKAGKAVWGLQLANAAVSAGRKVAVLDCTNTQSATFAAQRHELLFEKCEPWDFIRASEFDNAAVLCSFNHGTSLEVFLKYVEKHTYQQFNTVVVIVDEAAAGGVLEALHGSVTCILCVGYPFREDIHVVKNLLNGKAMGKYFIVSSNNFNSECSTLEALSADEIKLELPGSKVIKPYKFQNFNNDWLYQKLIGGNNA